MASFIRVFKQKWITPPLLTKEDYSGRIVIITGANTGIGKEAVYKFAALGALKIIMGVRDTKKGETTKAALEARLGTTDQLEVWELDMMSYDSVMTFAKRANELDHLDILVLNAGVWRVPYLLSKYGWEEDLQVNTLSTTLLAILLLPKLKDSKRLSRHIPILEFVNSGMHQSAIVPPEARERANVLDYYNDKANFKDANQYRFSKLFLMHAVAYLANKVSSEQVIITSVCPGWCSTGLGRDYDFPGLYILAFLFIFLFMKTSSQGADTILSGTTQGEGLHGRFWQQDTIKPIPPSLAGTGMKELGLRILNEILDSLRKDVPDMTTALDAALSTDR